MHQTSKNINLFELHDAVISSITIEKEEIILSLSFAFISSSHEANPFDKAQIVKPCTIIFQGVINPDTKIWNDKERVFETHPDPEKPIHNEIMEFEAIEYLHEHHIKITGYHPAGWAEWSFICKSFIVSWSKFSGNAWYEKNS